MSVCLFFFSRLSHPLAPLRVGFYCGFRVKGSRWPKKKRLNTTAVKLYFVFYYKLKSAEEREEGV